MKTTKQNLLTEKKLRAILDTIDIKLFDKPYNFRIQTKGNGYLIQLGFEIPDNDNTDIIGWQYGGKQYVSQFACKSEIVNKCFGMFTSFLIHEAREMFFYKGVDIFNAHVDIEQLRTFMKGKPFENR